MVIVIKMDIATRVQIMDKTISISNGSDTLWKGMNPIIVNPAQGKLGSSTLVWQPLKQKENS